MTIDDLDKICLHDASTCMRRTLDEITKAPEYVTGYWVRLVAVKNHDGTPDDSWRLRHLGEYGALVIHEGKKTPSHIRALFLYFTPDGKAYWYHHTTSGCYETRGGRLTFKSKNRIYVANVLHFGDDFIPTLDDIVAGMRPDGEDT